MPASEYNKKMSGVLKELSQKQPGERMANLFKDAHVIVKAQNQNQPHVIVKAQNQNQPPRFL